jgi:hypothetical protein
MNSFPFDKNNSINRPWLINLNKDELIELNGFKLSAEYIWNKEGEEREKLLKDVFDYYRKRGFPLLKLNYEELLKEYNKIKKVNYKNIITDDGEIKNSNNIGLSIVKHYCNELFYKVKTKKSKSVFEVFENDELFKKVLKNRMGWCSSSEDGNIRPFIFGITDKMIIQGIRSSGLSKSISQFKIPIAQYLYDKYCIKNGTILDYSAGWGSRLLGATSLNYKYIGIDPLTSDSLNLMIQELNLEGWVIKGESEDETIYKNIKDIDLIIGCPPYFNLEIYSEDISQCYNKYNDYNDWLEKYWRNTVKNCFNKLKFNSKFILIINEVCNKYKLREDMVKICEEEGLKIFKIYKIKTIKSHLSFKKESVQKYNDIVCVFEKL